MKLKRKGTENKLHHDAYDFWIYEMSIARISICVNNIICYNIMSKWKNWTQMVLMIQMYNLRILKEHLMLNRTLLGHWDHEYRIAKTAWLLHWEKIVAHFHIYCHEGTRMPKTLTSLQKWLMISLCTSFIHNFYTFWNTHKIKQWWSYFNTIKVVLILECNFVS